MSKSLIFNDKEYRKILEKNSEIYYAIGEQDTKKHFIANPGLKRLAEISKNCKRILEAGCGAGGSLELIVNAKSEYFGVDISSYAIKKAKKDFKRKENFHFQVANIEELPFESGYFDLVFCAYVLEHVINAEVAISDMVRVLKRGGTLVLIAPNYGSPIEFSPSFSMVGLKPLFHAVKLFLFSHLWLIRAPKNLAWNRVKPAIIKSKKYFQDSDTTLEPFVQTLAPYLESLGVEIREISSGIEWTVEEISKKNVNLPWKFKVTGIVKRKIAELGKAGFAPYKYFGPTLFVVGVKK